MANKPKCKRRYRGQRDERLVAIGILGLYMSSLIVYLGLVLLRPWDTGAQIGVGAVVAALGPIVLLVVRWYLDEKK